MRMMSASFPSRRHNRVSVELDLQSGFVGGGVVGQPTTVSEALHHDEAEKKYNVRLMLVHDAKMLALLAVLSNDSRRDLHRLILMLIYQTLTEIM